MEYQDSPPVPEDAETLSAQENEPGTTRREFLAVTSAVGIGATLAPLLESDASAAAPFSPRMEANAAAVMLNINGKDTPLTIEPRVTLLDALRDRLHMTGTKKGCDHGQCGACTVHIDGQRINSCLTLAIMHEGQKITTIEGLANGEQLHPMQAAFIEHDGFQCGYCTPGQIMSAVAVLNEGHARTDDELRDQMSGNICRCGAYPNIIAAIKSVQEGKAHA